MQSFIRIFILTLFGLAPLAALHAQGTTPAPSPAQAAATASADATDVYHVFIAKAALGKAKEAADFLKEPDPNTPDAKGILLRHQDGDEWDYIGIEYIGPKATVDLKAVQMSPAKRALLEWHTDTFVSGPSWAQFAKAMGLDGDAKATAGSVYVVADYRAAPGHREELKKMLTDNPAGATDTSSGNVLLTHVEGAAWNFLGVVRYDSWEKFAENEKASVTQSNKGQGGWFDLRNHVASHHDTLADRIMP
ncbi:MAG: hypothetical protein M3Q46_10940 [Verrucomicrobiota bacterium]|nr:hypothetical protein [Verrucomicrobiota bacterium]